MTQDYIEFSDAPGRSWDKETSELRIHTQKLGASKHIVSFHSRDRYGNDFELFDILDFFNLRSNHYVNGSIWRSFTLARLTELGFLGLVNVTERRSGDDSVRIHFEYEQEERAFSLSFAPYEFKYIEAHCRQSDKVLIIKLPVKADGEVDFQNLKACGTVLTVYKGIHRLVSERIINMDSLGDNSTRPSLKSSTEPECSLVLPLAPKIGSYFTLCESTEEEDYWNNYEVVRIN